MSLHAMNRIFWTIISMFIGIIAFSATVFYFADQHLIVWESLNQSVLTIPLYIWLLGMMIGFSFVVAWIITYFVTTGYSKVRQQLTLLRMGKYHHITFDQDISSTWDDNLLLIENEILAIKTQMIQQAQDLQELSASPMFIGEDTKEEIIHQERERIARELHDSVSQQLFAAMMLVSTLYLQTSDEFAAQKERIKQIEMILEQAQTEMRALLLHLRPVELHDRTLGEGLEQLLNELDGRISLEIKSSLDKSIVLESGIEDHIFRIAQEAITNSLRHADADTLEVYLTQTAEAIQLRIIDDGRGFNLHMVNMDTKYGLRNIQERVQAMGGTVQIQTAPNKGTTIAITIPHEEGEKND